MKTDAFEHLSDEEIIKLIIENQGNDLFSILYNKYRGKVLDKCYSLLKNKQQAEEFTEDIFSKIFEKLFSFKNMSKFSSWLYSVTYNHCIDYLRLKKKLHYPMWNTENEIPEIIDETEESFETFNFENLMIIMELIHPEEKALLLMKYQDELSLKEIGNSLRISEDATKMRLKRARTRVMYLYKQKFGGNN